MILQIHCNTSFQQWYKIQLFLQALLSSSYQNSLRQKFDLPKGTSSKNHGQIKIALASYKFTEYAHHQTLCKMLHQLYNFLLSLFLHNFKLKFDVIFDLKSLLVTELNKFEVIGLPHICKGILPFLEAKFPFLKLQYV